MELVVSLVVLGVIVWYLGKPINKVLDGLGEMSEDEFKQLRADQVVNNLQRDIKRTEKYQNIVNNSDNILTADDIINSYRKSQIKGE